LNAAATSVLSLKIPASQLFLPMLLFNEAATSQHLFFLSIADLYLFLLLAVVVLLLFANVLLSYFLLVLSVRSKVSPGV
jgi:hypothetical protein